jgi:hypothetical protein
MKGNADFMNRTMIRVSDEDQQRYFNCIVNSASPDQQKQWTGRVST